MPKSVVIDPEFDWGQTQAAADPAAQLHHLRAAREGLHETERDRSRKNSRGTYAGLGSEPAIEYLKDLGVTAVELLPVHAYINDKALVDRGLTNYWGYNSIGFFAPDGKYSSSGSTGGQVTEFKQMVRNLHDAGPRGHPRRCLQPHRGRKSSRPDALFSRHR